MALFKCSKSLLLNNPAIKAANLKNGARSIFHIFDKRMEKLPDPIDHATGNEKLLLILKEKGIKDPFMIDEVQVRGPATKDNPCLVPSYLEKIIIGCMCQEDQTHICYMWVHKEEMKRCECGHWFKAVDAPDLRELAYGKKEDSPEMF